MSATDRCEQFCTEPIGPDGTPGDEYSRACCAPCDRVLDWLCRDVLPSIRKHGFYAPPDASVDDEFAALIAQSGFRERLLGFLEPFEPARVTEEDPS